MNKKTNVVVSTYVDTSVKESQPDIDFFLFATLAELSEHIKFSPIRAQRLYITKEALTSAPTTALTFLADMLKNPFFAVDSVYYLSEEGSPELPAVDYMIDQLKVENWKVILGPITRERVTGYISGLVKTGDITTRKKVIYRTPKQQYVQRQISGASGDEVYPSDEVLLANIPEEVDIEPLILDVTSICRLITVTGLDCAERTMFAFVSAQSLALKGKTLILEHDFKYLTLSDYASRTSIDYLGVDVEEFYRSPEDTLNKIRKYTGNLVIVTCSRPSAYDYSFLSNVLYNSLDDNLDYFVLENSLEEVAANSYIVVMPNDVVSVLKTIEYLPDGFEGKCSFVGVNSKSVNEISIKNVDALKALIGDLTGMRFPFDVDILNFTSLTIGGSVHDLRMFLRG